MTTLSWYLGRMHGSCKIRTWQKMTIIYQAMCVGGYCESAKQSPWWAECRKSMLLEIQEMLKLWGRLNTLPTSEGGWEKSYESCKTQFRKKEIEVRLFPKTSQLVMVLVANIQWRRFLTLLGHDILLTKHGYSSTVSLRLCDLLLHWCLHYSPPLQPWRSDISSISWTTSRQWFCNRAQQYPPSIRWWTASPPSSSPFGQCVQPYRSRQRECVCRSRATSSSDRYLWYFSLSQPSSRQALR